MDFYYKIILLINFLRLSRSQLNTTNYALLTSFIQNNFSSESDFVKVTTASFWNTITTSDLLQLDIAKLQRLHYDDQGIIPTRIMQEISRLLLSNMTNTRIKHNLGLNQLSVGTLQQIRRSLPPPQSFTAANVTFLGDNILRLGSVFLFQIKNTSALQELNDIVYQGYISTVDPTLTSLYKSLMNHIAVKMYGPPAKWTNVTVQNMDVTILSVDVARQLSSDAIISRIQDFMEAAAYSYDSQLGRIYLKKILMKQNFLNLTNSSQVLNIINNSGDLMYYILPNDVSNPNLFSNQNISSIVFDNILNFASSGQIDPKTAFLILRSLSQIVNIIPGSNSAIDTGLIGLATPRVLKIAAKNGYINITNLNQIADIIQNGPGTENKLQTLSNIISNGVKDKSITTLTPYPNKVLSYLRLSTLKKISEIDANVILSRDPNVTIASNKMMLLLNKIQSGFTGLTLKARSLLTNAKIKAMKQLDLSQVANGLPPITSVAMAAAEKVFSRKLFIDSAEIFRSISFVSFMGAKEALKINQSDIINILYQMKDINPSWPACCMLKNIFYNYSRNEMGSTSEHNTIQRLTVGDIENMPVCVLACFGPTVIDHLGVDQKVALLTRMALMGNPTLILPRSFRMKLIADGLMALRNLSGLQLGDLDIIGNAIADIPGEVLSNADNEVIPDVINKLNKIILTTQLRPCLDNFQRAVIGRMVAFVKGTNASLWETVADVSCLLNYLPMDNLSSIPDEVLAFNTCELGGTISAVNDSIADYCIASIGEDDYSLMKSEEDQVKTLQLQAALNVLTMIQSTRLKRQTFRYSNSTLSICSIMGYSGANGFTGTELRTMSFNTIMSCLSDFGHKDMDANYAQILVSTLKGGWPENFTNLNASILLEMGFILKGIPASDLENIGKFSYGTEFDDVVEFLGNQKSFYTSQVQAWASIVKSKWKRPANMSATDLHIVNNLLCGFNSTDIYSLNVAAITGAIGTISKLENCPLNPVLISLANVAKMPTAYGNITNWNKSDVAELGVLIAGLAPEDVKKLDPTAMEGLTPAAMGMMSLDSLKVLDAAHFLFLNTAAGLSISPQQKSVLTTDVNKILNNSLRNFITIQKTTTLPDSKNLVRNCGCTSVVVIGFQLFAAFAFFL